MLQRQNNPPGLNAEEIMGDLEFNDIPQGYRIFFKKMLTRIAVRVFSLCGFLKLEQQLTEFVWDIMKFVICERVDLLVNRHVDLILLCSIFSVCKKAKKEVKFKYICTR